MVPIAPLEADTWRTESWSNRPATSACTWDKGRVAHRSVHLSLRGTGRLRVMKLKNATRRFVHSMPQATRWPVAECGHYCFFLQADDSHREAQGPVDTAAASEMVLALRRLDADAAFWKVPSLA